MHERNAQAALHEDSRRRRHSGAGFRYRRSTGFSALCRSWRHDRRRPEPLVSRRLPRPDRTRRLPFDENIQLHADGPGDVVPVKWMDLSPPVEVNELVRGKRGVTPETAWLLAQALGTTPEFWVNLQSQQDLASNRPARAERRDFDRSSDSFVPGYGPVPDRFCPLLTTSQAERSSQKRTRADRRGLERTSSRRVLRKLTQRLDRLRRVERRSRRAISQRDRVAVADEVPPVHARSIPGDLAGPHCAVRRASGPGHGDRGLQRRRSDEAEGDREARAGS